MGFCSNFDLMDPRVHFCSKGHEYFKAAKCLFIASVFSNNLHIFDIYTSRYFMFNHSSCRSIFKFNPIPAGVLENQAMLYITCFMSKYDKSYIIRKLLCSTLRICKKFANLQKFNFLSQNPFSVPEDSGS